MNTFAVLCKKEFAQMIRDFKIIWLPIVFILLGLTQPIMMYYLPLILTTLGGVDGITIDPAMTKLDGREVLASTLNSQFDQLGIIILVVAVMGVIQAEKASGILAFILTRPVSIIAYLGSKIVTHYALAAACMAIGYLVSYGYTAYLFSAIPIAHVILAFALYCIWLLFIITFVTMLSTIFNSQAFIALLSIIVLLLCRFTASLHPFLENFTPASSSLRATTMLVTGSPGPGWLMSLVMTLLFVIIMLAITHYWIAKKKV